MCVSIDPQMREMNKRKEQEEEDTCCIADLAQTINIKGALTAMTFLKQCLSFFD